MLSPPDQESAVPEATPASQSPPGDAALPPRRLNAADTTFIVIGAIVGVGIFFNPSQVARLAGSTELALLAWTLGGAIALCGALTFASLGSVFTGPGAQYEILRTTYGPLTGFLFVFCNATAIQAGATAIIALICADNLAVALIGTALAGGSKLALAANLIAGLVLTNIVGVRGSAAIQAATVIAKIAVLFTIAALAVFAAPPPSAQSAASIPAPTATATPLALILFSAVVPAFFSYGGWQHALWISGEVKNPRRNLPLGILLGTVIVVLVYLTANWAYLRLLGYAGVVGSRVLAADSVAVVWPTGAARAVAAGVAVSAFGVLNAQLLSGPRLIHRLASDGQFFKVFARLMPKSQTPAPAIILLGALALALLLAAGEAAIDRLTNGVVFLDGLFFILTGLAVFILRKRKSTGVDRMLSLGFPIAPALFVLGETGLVIGAHREAANRSAAFIGVIWVIVAAFLYLVLFRRGRNSPARETESRAARGDNSSP
jgi:APA family basic amino acid/polyamine antiporter